jgi:hypothetical protein
MSCSADVEMYGDARSSEIVHSKHGAYNISPHLVKDQDLPYGAVRGVLRRFIVGVVLSVDVGDGSVEIQYALDTGYILGA